jgi:aspartate 1-decarboxylase
MICWAASWQALEAKARAARDQVLAAAARLSKVEDRVQVCTYRTMYTAA